MTNIEFILHYLNCTTPKDHEDPTEYNHNKHISLRTNLHDGFLCDTVFLVTKTQVNSLETYELLEIRDVSRPEVLRKIVEVEGDVDKVNFNEFDDDTLCALLIHPFDNYEGECPGVFIISSTTGLPMCPYKLLSCTPWLLEKFLG